MASVETPLSLNVSYTSKRPRSVSLDLLTRSLQIGIAAPLIYGLVWAQNCSLVWLA